MALWAGTAPAGTSGWHLVSRSAPDRTPAGRGSGWHLVPTAPKAALGRTPESRRSALEQDVLANVNLLRRQHSLSGLRFSSALSAAARAHSVEMAERGFFSHDSADGSSFDKRIAKYYSLGGKRYWSVGENLLWSSPDVTASSALDMWLNSPEHKKILLSGRWREIGLAAVHVSSAPGAYGGREVTIVTADFGVRR